MTRLDENVADRWDDTVPDGTRQDQRGRERTRLYENVADRMILDDTLWDETRLE